ncbi:hypothetical protein GU926_07070 [Nibribacter ruber]|uniref:YtxH domain-containing protein n=1 Tax=Nibribacter ruber TaxID=2698458 RepID=A0A6P1NYS1_9BACT|nr:YtxH domain-containing protein [Nibribacter ruber]QHL87205.1 hypothetical protein GU926_07070 [Nibribacter ruber]
MKNDSTKILIAAAAGAAAGVVAGLLMAPGTGKDSRDGLMKMAGQVAESFNGQVAVYMEKFSGLASMLNNANQDNAMSVGADANTGRTSDQA